MPIEVRDKAESADRYWYFVVDVMTVAFIVGLMLWNGIPANRVGMQLTNWKGHVAVGVAAGGLRLLLLAMLVRLLPLIAPGKADDRLQRGSIRMWTTIFFTGAFSEELWIAFCLVALKTSGRSTATSVVLTALVFGAVHFEYRFGVLATAMYGALSALLFLWLGSLIPMFLFHFIGNLGSLYWARRGHQGSTALP
jgi:membrane protease YdiL (CAAX protease family)